jgi:hypothetical protein
MDEIVEAAMRKWPNIPDVYGWLALDRRGRWLLRGEPITNTALNEFIDRNYARDSRGCWFFQNGPQRVFAALYATPYVFSLLRNCGHIDATAHTGATASRIDAVILDSAGSLILATDLGPGLVQDRDLGIALDAACDEQGRPASEAAFAALLRGEDRAISVDFGSSKLLLETIACDEVATRFKFETNPAPPAAPASFGVHTTN